MDCNPEVSFKVVDYQIDGPEKRSALPKKTLITNSLKTNFQDSNLKN